MLAEKKNPGIYGLPYEMYLRQANVVVTLPPPAIFPKASPEMWTSCFARINTEGIELIMSGP